MKMIQKGLFRVCFQPITTLNWCTTCISWEIVSYNTQQSAIMNIRPFVAILSQNPQHDFPKMRGGGVKGRLELFRSFIRFGVPIRPLAKWALTKSRQAAFTTQKEGKTLNKLKKSIALWQQAKIVGST